MANTINKNFDEQHHEDEKVYFWRMINAITEYTGGDECRLTDHYNHTFGIIREGRLYLDVDTFLKGWGIPDE